MSLDHAILGFLNYQPFSGYDLKKIFDTTVRHFWPADQSQIYRTLGRLTEQGCVESKTVEQTGRPDRKVYHITAAGRRELVQWLAADPPKDPGRSPALVQVFFAGRMTDKEILAKFESFAVMMRGILKIYDGLPDKIDEYSQIVGSPRETYFWLSTLDLGKRTMRANLDWAENIIAHIKSRKIPRK
jgi:PadR family transcriptional regulator AphA